MQADDDGSQLPYIPAFSEALVIETSLLLD